MKAFHTNWSKVFAVKHPNQPYEIEDFELLTTMLSALEWRKHNGSIRMVTDQTGYDYYKKLGLLWIWDDGVDNVLDHLIPANVNPHVFWAAAKLYALPACPGGDDGHGLYRLEYTGGSDQCLPLIYHPSGRDQPHRLPPKAVFKNRR